MWGRYIAVGDSFTEGLDDRYAAGGYCGWADRLAQLIHDQNADLAYANLAIRGRKTDRIVREQIPEAIAQGPDLVTFAAGVNDLMGPRWDPATTFEHMSRGLAQLRAAGADVLVVAFGDPVDLRGPTARWRDRFEVLNRGTVALAREHGCLLLDFWPMTGVSDERHWSEDRLHLSNLGHRATAMAAAEVLGVGDASWRQDVTDRPAVPSRLQRVRSDVHWTFAHAVPWALRRVRNQSSGDEVSAKRPVLTRLSAQPLPETPPRGDESPNGYAAEPST